MSPSFRAVLIGLFALHRLDVRGQHDSPEADAIRDDMDAPWQARTEDEKQRWRRISTDLYAITDRPHSDGLPHEGEHFTI